MVAHTENAASGFESQRHANKFSSGRSSGQPRMSLRYLLFAAFIVISIIPVGVLALWVERSAYQKELAEVSERHLLIARNLSHALARYGQDVKAVFNKAAIDMDAGTVDKSMLALLGSMGFQHACIIDRSGSITASVLTAENQSDMPGLPDTALLRRTAEVALDEPSITGVMAVSDGRPMMFVVQLLSDGKLAVGALDTDYLVQLQQAIAFGEMGHSAIVDATGKVLAHPKESWRLEMMDISAIRPVQRMMNGETGVETFYSPALDADMIAGFTTVPQTGWGVMVPQPIAELEAHADSVQRVAIYIGVLGMIIAIILAWIVSRYLARPIERIAAVARSVEAGDQMARVGVLPTLTPVEIQALASSVNQMLGELVRSSDRLRDKADEAETANRAKSRFLANMSHEFRTPLSAIIGYSEIMKEEMQGPLGGDGTYSEYADSVHDAGVHILSMVNEILLLTRAETGHLELHPSDVDVPESVNFAVSMITTLANEGGLALETEVDPDVPSLWTDEGKLRQILLNLVSNAVKFTDEGGTVHISARTTPEWAAIITVKDSGVGIAPEHLNKVMKPFGQVQETYSRNHGGTGLGLPLTQELVTLMEGEFELQSIPGQGTEATIRLPLRAAETEVPFEAATSHEETAPEQ